MYWPPKLRNCSYAKEIKYRSCFHCCNKYTVSSKTAQNPLLTSPVDDKKPQQLKMSHDHLPKELAALLWKWNNVDTFSLVGRTLHGEGIQNTSLNRSSAYSWSIVANNLNNPKTTISYILLQIITRLGLLAKRLCTCTNKVTTLPNTICYVNVLKTNHSHTIQSLSTINSMFWSLTLGLSNRTLGPERESVQIPYQHLCRPGINMYVHQFLNLYGMQRRMAAIHVKKSLKIWATFVK